jgi:heme/copper-type cytochrome/quinol oxidase subunit 3
MIRSKLYFNNQLMFIYIINYDSKIYYSILIYSLIVIVSSYISMLFLPLLAFFIFFPLYNTYLISQTYGPYNQSEYLYMSLILFIVLEILLFIAYFWYYYHNYSYSYYPINQHILLSSNLYIISGLILSLLSIYLSIILLSIFIILTSLEFNNSLDILYINDNPLTIVQLTIVFLHLLHLIVGILLILIELIYPYYYHFIEVIWLLIGYAIYLS